MSVRVEVAVGDGLVVRVEVREPSSGSGDSLLRLAEEPSPGRDDDAEPGPALVGPVPPVSPGSESRPSRVGSPALLRGRSDGVEVGCAAAVEPEGGTTLEVGSAGLDGSMCSGVTLLSTVDTNR